MGGLVADMCVRAETDVARSPSATVGHHCGCDHVHGSIVHARSRGHMWQLTLQLGKDHRPVTRLGRLGASGARHVRQSPPAPRSCVLPELLLVGCGGTKSPAW